MLRLRKDMGEIYERFLIHAKHILPLKYNKEKEEEKESIFEKAF